MPESPPNPAADPSWGPNRLVRTWAPRPVGEGELYDPISDEVYLDPDYSVTNHGPRHKDTRDPYDLDPRGNQTPGTQQ